MNKVINEFFSENKIEYFAVLDYSHLRQTNPRIIAREGFTPRSVIMFLIPYYVSEGKNISTYATSLDYHIIIKRLGDGLIERLRARFPTAAFHAYGDHSPIDECHGALIAGLGILGESGLLINEKYGTYIFIADVITDIPPSELGAKEPEKIKYCSRCGACKRACPTGILVAHEGKDCLSAITQRKGELSEEEIEIMKKCDTVWGCDLCQRSCPHNQSPVQTPIDFFREERIECLTGEVLNALSDEEFERRAFAWRKRATVKRNVELLGY